MQPDLRRERDTERKVKLAAESLAQLAIAKRRTGAWGQVAIKLLWEDGYLKTVEISDTTTIKDLPAEDVKPNTG